MTIINRFQIQLLLLMMIIRLNSSFNFKEILDFFRYKHDVDCSFRSIKPDGLVITNDTNGLVFFKNKVWQTNPIEISNQNFKYLHNIYPQLNQFNRIDSVFTFLDRNKKLNYCFITQESTYFLYLTQLTIPTLKHHEFTNQIFINKGDLKSLIIASNFTSLFYSPNFCSLILPAYDDIYIFFFFAYYTKYTNCEVSIEYKKINLNQADKLTNLYPIFKLTNDCYSLEQDNFNDHTFQACRFITSKPDDSSSKKSFILIGN